MVGARFFNSGIEPGRRGVASEIARLEIIKNGKLEAPERYKMILKRRLAEQKKLVMNDRVKLGFKMPGNLKDARKMSKMAEQKLKELAQRKANKEARRLHKMVIITPRNFQNGKLDKKGKIHDIAGNVIGQVNTKNGKMSTMFGTNLGKYKPKSYLTLLTIQQAIDQHSPYFINLRKQQLLQQQGVASQYGVFGAPQMEDTAANQISFQTSYGSDPQAPRQNIGATAWGARSDNVWGSFADNTWGTSSDNVWGTNFSDVWGGIGVGGMWGVKGPNVWGTGSGRNYIAKLTNAIASLFGYSTKQNRERLQALNRAAARASSAAGATTRSAAPAPNSGRR